MQDADQSRHGVTAAAEKYATTVEFKDPPAVRKKSNRGKESLGSSANEAGVSHQNGYISNRKDGDRSSRAVVEGSVDVEISVISKVFDVEYYAREYPDLDFDRIPPILHYVEVGWREGRNPNAFFDTVSYFLQNPDVARADINPYYHYLLHGAAEGRQVESSITPSSRARLLFGHAIVDWVKEIEPHIDLDFYRQQFIEPIHAGVNLVAHYAYRGWREGKLPSADFDPNWIARHAGINRYMVNPLLIKIRADEEGFDTSLIEDPASRDVVEIEVAESELSDSAPSNQDLRQSGITELPDDEARLNLVATEFDPTYYLNAYSDVAQAGIDPLDHFFYTGWREGRNPNNWFDTDYYKSTLQNSPDAGLNPFWHFLAVGRSEGRSPRPPELPPSQADQTSANSDIFSIVKAEFDPSYYLATYPDVADAGIDPLTHYCYEGWKEGRNPNDQFESSYYLGANEDVKDANINPFWHYLVSGKAEGRLPRRPGGYKRALIDAALVPSERAPVNPNPDEEEISESELVALLRRSRRGKQGLVVSLSHDCYPTVIGGTQIFIADEQKRFNEQGYAYIHLSPQLARLTLAPRSHRFLTRVVANGEYVGLVEMEALDRYFQAKNTAKSTEAVFVVHCALGFCVDEVIRLRSAFRPIRSVYWLHDYSSLCPGFNLLRNDVEFCGAPPPSSLACRVCVYGKEREAHLSEIASLFRSCNFDVLSPSKFALDLWLRSSDAPHRSAQVHRHWYLEPQQDLEDPLLEGEPLSVAFLGYASPNKGWPIFKEIVRRLGSDPSFRFFHLAARNVATLPKVEFVRTEVTPENRQAALEAISGSKIRILLLLSPWPETFSFVAHEAIAAGAFVFCLEDSGNVADFVRHEDVGKVFADADSMIEFLLSGGAERYIRTRLFSRHRYLVQNTGTTATSDLGSKSLKQVQ
jgi:hypothetical protein